MPIISCIVRFRVSRYCRAHCSPEPPPSRLKTLASLGSPAQTFFAPFSNCDALAPVMTVTGAAW
jgi:hypothetical protein